MYLDKTFIWSYNALGNITQVKEYAYTEATSPTGGTTTVFMHQNGWGNQVTIISQGTTTKTISYDSAGNPTNYKGATLTWTRGRLLASYKPSGSSYTTTMQYDANGVRYSKVVPTNYYTTTTSYFYDGNKLAQEKVIVAGMGGNPSTTYKTYLYSSQGIVGFAIGSTVYTYRKNLFGDIIAIYQGATKKAAYLYDAWGNCTITQDTDGVGTANPFRYRGYYWDNDLQLYYLMSRYYDPATGRFINADSLEYLDPETIGGLNLYSYCGNNPVMGVDPYGTFVLTTAIVWGLIIGAVTGAAIGFGTVAYTDLQDDGELFNGSVKRQEYVGGILTGTVLGASVGGIIGAGGATLTKALSSVAKKFIADLFAYSLTGTQLGTWEDYAVAFISGGLIEGFGMKGFVKDVYDVVLRPAINQLVKIGTNRTESFSWEKWGYDIVTRGLSAFAPDKWRPFYRGLARSFWDLLNR